MNIVAQRTRIGLVALLLAACLAGCCCGGRNRAGPDAAVATAAKTAWIKSELYFGLSKPGGTVSGAEWAEFLDREATPRFPDGLTVVDASGQWRNAAGTVAKEPSKILILVHKNDPAPAQAIEQLIAAYKKRFQQESVLWVKQPVEAGF